MRQPKIIQLKQMTLEIYLYHKYKVATKKKLLKKFRQHFVKWKKQEPIGHIQNVLKLCNTHAYTHTLLTD